MDLLAGRNSMIGNSDHAPRPTFCTILIDKFYLGQQYSAENCRLLVQAFTMLNSGDKLQSVIGLGAGASVVTLMVTLVQQPIL